MEGVLSSQEMILRNVELAQWHIKYHNCVVHYFFELIVTVLVNAV